MFPDPPLPATACVEARVTHKKLHVNKSTFKGGLDAPFHRWFRLTPSFGPELVQHVLEEFGADVGDVVLDPFSGAGTTPIECRLQGLRAFGFEINPFLHFVAHTCLEWELDADEGRRVLNDVHQNFREASDKAMKKDVEELGLPLPTIHNVFRWWRRDVLKDILLIKNAIQHECKAPKWRELFRLCLAAVLVPDLTNVTLGRLQLFFIDREHHDIRAWPTYESHMLRILEDLSRNRPKTHSDVQVLHTDATAPAVPERWRADYVITSPPYPNRYSYVWNTRPHLYMLDFFSGKTEAADLDKRTIGGTWGTATSILAKGTLAPECDAVRDAVGNVVARIRASDNLMANYVMKYFNLLARQISSMDRFVSPDVSVAYVVGNSCVKDVYVETDVILGKIFEGLGLGYRVLNIERFRKRHSGTDLYETTVFATKKRR